MSDKKNLQYKCQTCSHSFPVSHGIQRANLRFHFFQMWFEVRIWHILLHSFASLFLCLPTTSTQDDCRPQGRFIQEQKWSVPQQQDLLFSFFFSFLCFIFSLFSLLKMYFSSATAWLVHNLYALGFRINYRRNGTWFGRESFNECWPHFWF